MCKMLLYYITLEEYYMRRNWLKSAILLVLCLCLVLALAACGGKKNKGDSAIKDPGTKPPITNPSCSHVPGPTVRENEIPGGCSSPTTYDEVTYCIAGCGTELSRVQRMIPASGHIYNDSGYCINCSSEWPASAGLSFYSNGDGTCRLTSIGECTDTDIVIPYTAPWGDRVVWINSSVFYLHSEIRSVTIPPTVEYIGESAFYGCHSLTEINIPDSVTQIEENAFNGCAALKSVNIGAGVTSIGEQAFYNCPSLENITVSEDNTAYKNIDGNHIYTSDGTTLVQYAIGSGATSFAVPEGVTTISSYAFSRCTDLISVVLADSVETIGRETFSNCINLVSIRLGAALYSVGSDAFWECGKLVEVINLSSLDVVAGSSSYGNVASRALDVHTEASKVDIAGDYVFYTKDGNNYLLGYVGSERILTLPENYNGESYGVYSQAFSYDEEISSVVMSNGVDYVGAYAFSGCSSLVSVTVGANVTAIDFYAFDGCTKLFEVVNCSDLSISAGSSDHGRVGYYATVISLGESRINNVDGYLFYALSPKDIYLLGYVGGETVLVLPDSYDGEDYIIHNSAFYGMDDITSLTIGAGVASIGYYAFNDLDSLEEIYFNARAMAALPYDCNAFSYSGRNSGGIRVVIGSGVTEIPDYLFAPYGSSIAANIVSVEFAEDSICDTIGDYAFYGCGYLESASIGDSVTTVGQYAFYGCTNLKSLTVGRGLTNVGSYAFAGCTDVEELYFNAVDIDDFSSYNGIFDEMGMSGDGVEVVIGSGVTRIPTYLFCPADGANAPKLISVEFADGSVCTSIGSAAFYNCRTLESLVIPASIESISSSAFYNCTGLNEIYFNATAMNDMFSYNGVFSYAGQSGSGITLTVGANVTKIPAYLFCPDGGAAVPNVTSLEFEEGSMCESIGSYAFYGCSYLTEITIPERVEVIGDYAFYGCTDIEEIYFNATSMDDLSSYDYVFYNAGTDTSGIAVVFGANVTKVPAYLFCPSDSSYAPKLTSVEFGEDSACYSIGNSAFYYCDDLEEIAIPSGVISIGALAFYGCAGLTDMELPSGLERIGDSAFRYCDGLEYVIIPLGVESIGSSAFEYCDSLTVYCEADATPSGWSSSWNNSSRPVVYGYGSEEYTYTFITNGAEDIDPIVSAAFITLPEPTLEDYVFFGWYDNADLLGTPVGEVYYSSTQHTLYAKWVHVSELADGTSFERALTKYADGVGSLITIDESGEVVYFRFTAATSKTYFFYSTGSYDSYFTLYDSSCEYIDYDDDDGDGNNFSYSCYIEEGTTVYLGVRMWSSTTGSYYFYVE